MKDNYISFNKNYNDTMNKLSNGKEVNENYRKYILDRANDCVNGKREQDYGTPEDNFTTIAELWTDYYKHDFTAHDVAIMLALLKIGRIATGKGSLDNYIDLAGYAACAGEIWESKNG